MLPALLCEELCSLNPGVERFAFSVEWELNAATGAVLSMWAGRSVICSCAKLAYPMVQVWSRDTPIHTFQWHVQKPALRNSVGEPKRPQ
eukprot:309822-Chlamydomonas_euryale.AAC.2